jgi:hypothetical protein
MRQKGIRVEYEFSGIGRDVPEAVQILKARVRNSHRPIYLVEQRNASVRVYCL